MPKLGCRFPANVTKPATEENLRLVEKQVIQYFRGEDTLTISDEEISGIDTRKSEEIV